MQSPGCWNSNLWGLCRSKRYIASVVRAMAAQALPPSLKVGRELHDDQLDHSLHDRDPRNRRNSACRLMTTTGAAAFESGGLTMEVADDSDDALWQKHQMDLKNVDYFAMASASPVNPKTGRPLDGVELAAFEREKRKAQDRIVEHAEVGMRQLERMRANIGGNRSVCGSTIAGDARELGDIGREVARASAQRAVIVRRLPALQQQARGLQQQQSRAEADMKALIARSKSTGRRLKRQALLQQRHHGERQAEAQRGYSMAAPALARTPSPVRRRPGAGSRGTISPSGDSARGRSGRSPAPLAASPLR